MDEINYPTAYALYVIKKYTGQNLFGLPIIDTDCFYSNAMLYNKNILLNMIMMVKIHEEYEVIYMKKRTR
ncbi:MAG: hypothetical protein L6V81_00230 [Clostridium sp.]|nr:MAG: hypothetical protein L6V81_00230 [Clostridium sp.]